MRHIFWHPVGCYIWFGCMTTECLVWQFWSGGLQMMEWRKSTNKTCITSNNFLQTQGHKLSSAFFVVLSFEVGVKLLYRDVTKIVLFSFLQIHYTSAFLFLISYYIYICCENDISLYMPDIFPYPWTVNFVIVIFAHADWSPRSWKHKLYY